MVSAEDFEKLRAMIGKEFEPFKVVIERGMIRRLAEAIGDTNPLWQDEARARESKYGDIIASPALYVSKMMSPRTQGKITMPVPVQRGLDAQDDWKFYRPIRPGDVITVTSKLVDVYEKQGKKSGRMVFPVVEATLTNQQGEKVGVVRGSIVMF